MIRLILPVLLLLSALTVQLQAQNSEDYLLGNFINEENQLSLNVTRREDLVYEGAVKFQGTEYPYEGIRLLGALVAEYQYQGNNIPFSLELDGTDYLFTSEGITLLMKPIKDAPPSKSSVSTSFSMSAVAPKTTSPSGSISPAAGALLKDPYGAYTFNVPVGWQGSESNGYYSISKSGEEVQFSASSHNYSSKAALRADASDLNSPEKDLYLKVSFQEFGENGIIVRWTGTTEGKPFAIETVSLCSPHGGGVTFVGAGVTSPPAFSTAHADLLMSMAKSVKFFKPLISTEAQQWAANFTGKQLVYLSTSGGGTERTDIDLCSDGTFVYKYESSYSSGGSADFAYAGNDLQEGTWKVLGRGTASVLVLYFSGGSSREYTLVKSQTAGEVLLNSTRYFVQGNKRCN